VAISTGSSGGTVKADINVTPMIDVMLVLLIIFMIVTPLIAAGFKATLPRGKNLDKDPEGADEIVLGIDASGNYFLNGSPVRSSEDLLKILTDKYAARPDDKTMYFKADQQLKYGKVQEGIEIARKAGVRVVAAVTEPTTQAGLFGAKKKDGEK
jgi:biopolymer transport protein ExbD